MDRPNRHIEEAADQLRNFVRSLNARVLGFEASADALPDVGALALAFEHHADNRAVFLPITVAGGSDRDAAWTSATGAAREAYSERREQGAPLTPLGPAPLEGTPAAAFSLQLHSLVGGIEPPVEGMVVVFKLGGTPARGVLDDLTTIVRAPELRETRFIVCGADGCGLEAWIKGVRKGEGWFHRVIAPAPQRGAPARSLEGDRTEIPRAGIWPSGVRPPPLPKRPGLRAKAPPPVAIVRPPSGENSAAEGVPDERAAQALEDLAQQEIIGAAEAMQQGEGAEAIRLQAQARDRFLEAGRTKDGVEMELMLAGYLLELGQPRLASQTLGRAAVTATGAGEYELAIKAFIQQGAAAERDDDLPAALAAYRQAIETSTGVGDSPGLAMEAYWNAGQAARASDLDLDAIALWGDAVVYGSQVDADRLQGSPARSIANELAELLVAHRRYSQAREIERLATEF